MAEVTPPPRPLAPDDDRIAFDCGRGSLNAWFRDHGWHNHASGISRTTVVCDASTGSIAGFVTLSSAQIRREFLAKAHRRNKPDPVPATLLGQLAIHATYHRHGLARSLLFYALTTALRASRDVGSFGVLTHPIDEMARAFYRHHGFEDVPFDPKRSMMVRMIDLEKNGFGQ
jgi:GNAT superfamily N-acetyltransferase